MARGRLILAFIASLLLIAGCGSRNRAEHGQADPRETAAALETVRGFAVFGHEVRSFRACGTEEELWAIDKSGLLWELHKELALNREPYEEVFAIVEGLFGPPPEDGFGSSYPGALEVTRVLYMTQEGFRCNLDLSQFCYRTYGNEPSWSVRVSADGITLRMPGSEELVWPDISRQASDNGAIFTADGPAGPIELHITEEPCRDTMSGAYFAYAARMRLGPDEFAGCALKGTGQPGKWR